MEASPWLRVFSCLLVKSLLLDTPKAEIIKPRTGLEKRYYHHEVYLDDNRHNDEFYSFVTRPDLDAPKWDIQIFDKDTVSPGFWFSAPYSEVAQGSADAPWNAPHIYDGQGELVWSGAPVFDGFTTFDFRVVDIQGKPMLSVIYPRGGKAIIFDETYQIHKTIDLGDEELRENEPALNVHEFTTVENGTKALYMTRMPKRSSKENSVSVDFDGECFAVFDGIRELDTWTWNTIHSWDSEGHVGLDESYVTSGPVGQRCTGGNPWDFFHANSIDTFPNGDYLVSGRRTNTLYRISHTTGSIIWRLGGRKSDFELPLEFSGQHAAKLYEHNDTHTVLSFLDNAFLPPGVPQTTHSESRGLLLALDTSAMTAKLVSEFPHPEGTYATSRGNMQMLPNTNAWLCWTDGSLQSEHTFDGTIIMKARFKAKIASYRTFKFPWIGKPRYPPDVHAAVIDKNGDWYTIVHMSWNGATEVNAWNIIHTNAEGTKSERVATVPKRGFETLAWTDGYGEYVVVEALDKNGETLGVSNVFASLPPRNHSQSAFGPNIHSNGGNWLRAVIESSITLFVFGVFLGGLVVCLASGLSKRLGRPQHEGSFAWWKRMRATYQPLTEEEEEAHVELEAYADVAGDEEAKGTGDSLDKG